MSDMFKVLILVCLADTPPADCQWDTAVDVISGPWVANEIACVHDGQAYLAQTPFVDAKTYPKFVCMRIPTERRSAEARSERQ